MKKLTLEFQFGSYRTKLLILAEGRFCTKRPFRAGNTLFHGTGLPLMVRTSNPLKLLNPQDLSANSSALAPAYHCCPFSRLLIWPQTVRSLRMELIVRTKPWQIPPAPPELFQPRLCPPA